ncbi:hypothetical protein BRD03_10570 [Halobacteriales archaeon QS_9_68_17]|nr:MAG: hypothetical protein BRD03_10570 [Halobacteriales archaeon QS_9_68_17]
MGAASALGGVASATPGRPPGPREDGTLVAVSALDRNGNLADFSQYGSKVDVARWAIERRLRPVRDPRRSHAVDERLRQALGRAGQSGDGRRRGRRQ